MEQVRSHLRLVTEECDMKIRARWAEEQAEIEALKRERQQLQKYIKDMKEREMDMKAVVHKKPKWFSV